MRVEVRGWCLTKNLLVISVETVMFKDNVNTAHCLVDSRLINTRFVSYIGWALPHPQ